MEGVSVDQLVNYNLTLLNKNVRDHFGADCVFINSGMQAPLDDVFRIVIEDLRTLGRAHQKLVIMLQTRGGSMETVERLVEVSRHHYETVVFVIPNYAYSAGTVLALSGDSIFMDYYSVLGPIDPQYQENNGNYLLPGLGYLSKFEELLETVNRNPSLHKGELAFLIEKFDAARLFHIEQIIDHGEALITEWLVKYKFKDWETHSSSQTAVTLQEKNDRAREVSQVLGDAKKWHSHGRGITMKELTGNEIRLKIEDFSVDEEMYKNIRNYHGLGVDFFTNKQQIGHYIHSACGMRRVL